MYIKIKVILFQSTFISVPYPQGTYILSVMVILQACGA